MHAGPDESPLCEKRQKVSFMPLFILGPKAVVGKPAMLASVFVCFASVFVLANHGLTPELRRFSLLESEAK